MNIRKLLLSSIVMLGFCGAANATVYHLVCRGSMSGNTYFQVTTGPNVDGIVFAAIHYDFERYTRSKSLIKTDGSHLSPGQCSWSTGLLSSNQTFFEHYINRANVSTHVGFAPVTDGVMQLENASYSYLFPDRQDVNQTYLPTFIHAASVEGVKGSILDPNYIFHIYVAINSDGSLQFSRFSSAVKLY